jgi:hypothetical protein
MRTCAGALALAAVVLVGAGSASAGIRAPGGLSAHAAGGGPAVPYLAWSAVRGADHYELQVAADASFRAPVPFAADVITSNTRATLLKTLPSHPYWWRVRAVSKNGSVSGWATRTFAIAWRPTIKRLGATSEMRWSTVSGATKYSVELSNDQSFAAAALVGGRPIVAATNSVSPPGSLPVNTYYWRVTALDAEGNPAARTSPVFQLDWTHQFGASRGLDAPTNCIQPPNLTDFPSGTAVSLFCPVLSWQPIAGASRYDVEINADNQWAAGSKACCDALTASTRYTPTVSLLSNKYYWRVRGIDGSGNAGPWVGPGTDGLGTDADSFTRTFDNVCSANLTQNCLTAPSISDLHLEDAAGNRLATGSTTGTPVVAWNPVPGASSYEYQIAAFTPQGCQWGTTARHGVTATTAWSPLGSTSSSFKPYPDGFSPETDKGGDQLQPNNQYCVRVRAQGERDPHGRPVYGDFAYLPNADTPAFHFSSFPTCAPSGGVTNAFATPAQQNLKQMPVLHWTPPGCATSYWVIVARDASFTNIVDYAFTQAPVYAPRKSTSALTYADETTHFYWVVLPSGAATGQCGGSACDPLQAHSFTFDKQVPPTSLQVEANAPQPTFSWNPVPGGRHYELQVSQDQNFGSSFVDKVTTAATSYTATITYPPGKQLFWRVRADDETLTGLSWASWNQGKPFTVELPAPADPHAEGGATGGVTTLRWNPLDGAVSYDVHLQLASGSSRDYQNLRVTQLALSALPGTGAVKWQVRAKFARGGGAVAGPYSALRSMTQIVWQPGAMHTLRAGRGLVLSWSPVAYARGYRVQVASRRDFSAQAESAQTDNPAWAPRLQGAFAKGGSFWWRVAAVDSSGNLGKFTNPVAFRFPAAPGR